MKLITLLCRVCLIFGLLLVSSCSKDKDTEEPVQLSTEFLSETVWTAKHYSMADDDQKFYLVRTENIYFIDDDRYEVDMYKTSWYMIKKDVFYIFGARHLIVPLSSTQFELRTLQSGVSLEPTPTNKHGYRHKIVFTRKGGHR